MFSGAGLSADSGIATFRDKGGLWENHRVEQVADGHTWRQNWDLVRRFYNERRSQLGTVTPNAMHYQIAAWEERYNTILLTQNIDDLLERAGCQEVIHLHGELTKMWCVACGHAWDIRYGTMGESDRCTNPKCNSLKGVRPQVVFFNEHAPNYARMHQAFRKLSEKDCVVVIGTSGQVISLDPYLLDCAALKILNNLAPSLHMDERWFDHVLYGKAEDMAPHVNALITKHMYANDPTLSRNDQVYKELRRDEQG